MYNTQQLIGMIERLISEGMKEEHAIRLVMEAYYPNLSAEKLKNLLHAKQGV